MGDVLPELWKARGHVVVVVGSSWAKVLFLDLVCAMLRLAVVLG